MRKNILEMSDSKENEEGGQGMPSAVEESQQLVDAEIQVQPEASNHVENGKAAPPSEDHIENGKAETLAEDENVKPVMAEPPAEDNEKPVKAEPPVEDKSVNPGKAELPADDNTVKPGKVELPAENNTAKAGKVELPAEDNTVKSGKVELPAEDNSVEAVVVSEGIPQQDVQNTLHAVPVEADAPISNRTEYEASKVKTKAKEFPKSNTDIEIDNNTCQNNVDAAEPVGEVKPEACEAAGSKTCDNGIPVPSTHNEPTTLLAVPADKKAEMKNESQVESKADEKQAAEPADNGNSISKHMSFLDPDHFYNGNESGTEEEQSTFMKELENFFRERSMEFKPPKFYGEGLNCLKLWRAVTRLGGYDKVTSCKLWRQVGESFKPPKTCTTVSWTFRGFYEKALLDYERHKIKGGELNVPIASQPEPVNNENQSIQASVPGRARRDAAARAMQGWHSQRLLGNGEVSDPIIKDRNSVPTQKREKQLKSINLLKRKKPSYMDNPVKAARSKPSKPQLDTAVVDVGPPADWVKVNVQKTKDCFEVYALVPGLLREEDLTTGKTIGVAKEHGGLYTLHRARDNTRQELSTFCHQTSSDSTASQIWLHHRRLGHPPFTLLRCAFNQTQLDAWS